MRERFSRFILGACAAVAILAASASAADPPAPPHVSEEQIQAWVRQLGDDDCQQREAATAELAKVGLVAKDALTAVLEHPDFEVRIRARQLLTTMLADDFERRLNEFAEDTDDQKQLDLPGWKRFKQEFGNKGEARKLFVAMQRAEHALLEASAHGPRQAAAAVTARYNAAQASLMNRVEATRRNHSVPTTAALLFAATDPEVKLSDGAAGWLATMARQNPFAQAVTSGGNDGIPRRLLIRWIEHPLAAKAANVAEMNLAASVQYNLPEALTPALQILALNTSSPFEKQTAILVVAKRGGKENLPVLEPFLKDEARCGIMIAARGIRNPPAEIQIRDIALAATIYLSGQNPRDFGYDRVRTNEQLLYQPETIGFADADKRDAAFKTWAESAAAMK